MGATKTVASGQEWPYGVVLDGNFVYWTNRGLLPTKGAVMKFVP